MRRAEPSLSGHAGSRDALVMVLPTALRDLLAPPACLACGAPGGDLCGVCRRALPWLCGLSCRRCGLPAPCGEARRPACPAAQLAFDRAWAPVAYAGPAQALVGALKFRGARAALESMAAAMARPPDWLLDGLGGRRCALVPVPTARVRVRSRGFDQAAELARALDRRGVGRLAVCLERGGSSARQLGAARAERLAPGRLDVRLRRAEGVPDACVLVDDVHTTGATLDACARVLKGAGARRVVALTYARALP